MNLSNVKLNCKAKIIKLNIQDINILRRICDLGLYPNQTVTVLNKSILKKVVLLSVKNYTLCLQTKIANCIEVQIEH